MKITFLLLTGAFLQVGAKGVAQNVTYSGKDVKLETVFNAVEQQTGYAFFYNDRDLKKATPISVDLKNTPLEDALAIILKNQPLNFSITGKTIVIKEKPSTTAVFQPADNSISLPPPIDITGKVTDADGNPLAGANVKVKGSSKATTTNADGVFVLKGVDENATLEISFVGYETYTVAVANKTAIVASLKVKPENLNEVVINKGYYTERQKLSVSNVGKVTSKDIENQPVSNPLLALQGRVAGLFITQSNGLPGSGVTVRIQGQNSLLNGSDPLYVIDGVPYASQTLPTISKILGSSEGNFTRNGSGNPLSFINPSDIESIDVLKDADATSIYGSRAAAGAILITTKKGKAGLTKVDVNVQNGWGKVTRKLDVMNTEQYLEMRKEAYTNDGLPVPNSSTLPTVDNYDLTVWDQNRNTDWQKVLIGNIAQYFDAQTSASGGSANTQFFVGAGYHRETTVFPGDLADKKGSLHFNINNVSSNQKFRLQLSGNYIADNNRLQASDLTNLAITLQPNAPEIYNADGTLNWAQLANGTSTWVNPLAYSSQKYQTKTSNLVGNAVIGYQILPNLNIKSSFGYTDLRSNEISVSPLTTRAPETRPTAQRISVFGENDIRSWIIEPQGNFACNLGKGKMDLLVGLSFQQRNNNGQQLVGRGFNSDVVMEDIKSAPTVTVNSTLNSVYNYNAFFGRLNYNLLNKYILNITARRDGSSRFGSNNLFNNFWSVAGAWVFNEERFIQRNLSFISFGKLRLSYGTTGNDQIGDYTFMNLFTPVSAGTPYQGSIGLLPNGIPNPSLQWEETRKLQAGIDLGFFTNRLLLTANYFQNRSSNQLLPYPLPGTTGFQSIGAFNLPATIQNSGLEFSLQTVIVRTKDFNWTSNLNLTIPKNKLINFPDLENSAFATSLIIGQPFTLTKVYHYLGLNQTTGLYEVADINGSPTSNPNLSTDATVLVNTSPKFYGGFQNSLSFKGFSLDVLFQFVKQVGSNYFFGNSPGQYSNQPLFVLNRWQKSGDNASVQKYSYNPSTDWLNAYAAAKGSDKALSDASFIRLKNISLSWQLPKTWIRKVYLQNGRFFLHAQNLITITNYPGLDPENKSRSSLPPLRVLTIGAQFTF